MTGPYDSRELEERLDELLFPVLSSRRTAAGIAAGLAPLARAQQDLVLHWVKVAVHGAGELAYQIAAQAPHAFARFGPAEVERWILGALDVYDREGLYAASAVLKDLGAFGRGVQAARSGVALAEVERMLTGFLRGLAGRALALAPDEHAWTDTETVYLPARLERYASRAQNRELYCASAAFHWGQARYGSFDTELGEASGWLPLLEAIRIEARLRRDLPGLGERLARLRDPWPARLDAARARLERPGATVRDSLALRDGLRGTPVPPAPPWCGKLDGERARAVRAARIARERTLLARELAGLREQRGLAPDAPVRLEAHRERDEFRVELAGEALAAPPALARLLASIVQDHGAIAPEWLVAAGEGALAAQAHDGARVDESGAHAEGGSLYDEWDHRRGAYRRDWCVLFESDVPQGDAAYVGAVRTRRAGAIAQLKRRFEALRDEERLLKREPEGEDVDFDALVEAWADARGGREPSARLFTRRRRAERDIAVMIMVDMSGSTKGWVNDCEREALVMLCEALEALGDRYAIYGFSGWSRKRCESYRVKRFDEDYGEAVRARIAGIAPRDYTRMGVAVRHLAKRLAGVEARTRVLFTLSDGKPDDFHDGYRGAYGIEDTRQALIEARQAGIHPFCVTIDRAAPEYLSRLYGPARWTLVDDAGRLPLRVAEIYRRITC